MNTEVEKLKLYYTDTLYSTTRKEQELDELFYNDRFGVPQILSPVRVLRTGRARRLIDGPAAQIVTSNPQASRRALKENTAEIESDKRILSYLNHITLPAMKRSNPNRFREFVKKQLLRGEGWIQTLHNSKWVENQGVDPNNPIFDKGGLPLIFRVVDPLIVFASPEEDENGVPKCVFLVYDRPPEMVKAIYPNWTNPKHVGDSPTAPDNVKWWEYWDKDKRIFSADGEYVLKTEENPYGFVPFVHKVAGFGTESFSGKMEDFIVGRLKFSRDTLVRECAMISSIDYSIHTFSNNSIDVQPIDDRHKIPKDFPETYELGTGLVHELPYGVTVTRAVEIPVPPQTYAYLNAIEFQLEMEDPLAGSLPIGESGRQQDMTVAMSLRKYDSVIENTNHAFSTAIGQGLNMFDVIPGLRPDELKKGDFRSNYEVIVDLKAEDPLENDRKATLGSRLLSGGEIDPITNLIDFKGYTKEDAEKIMVNKLAWEIMLTDPEMRAFLANRGIMKSGMAQEMEEFRATTGGAEGSPQQTPSEKRRLTGEVKTPEGGRQVDVSLTQGGARTPPVRA